MTIITVASSKGGVGKTTTAVSVASLLALLNTTILVDLDQQGHAAMSFGLDATGGVYQWLIGSMPVDNCLLSPREALPLAVLPSNHTTKFVETYYAPKVDDPERGRREIVAALQRLEADWIICDTASRGILQEGAIAAADILIMPFEPERFGVDGLGAAIALMDKVNAHAPLLLAPTSFDKRLADHNFYLADVLKEYGPSIVMPPIPARSAVKSACSAGRTIWEFDYNGMAEVRSAYAALGDRVRLHAMRRTAADAKT